MLSGLMGIFRAMFGAKSKRPPTPAEPLAPQIEPTPEPTPSPFIADTPAPAALPETRPTPVPAPQPTTGGARLIEDTAGKTRDLPIAPRLRELLIAAANEAGVDTVRVTSGGQCAIGTCTQRHGSTRHDLGEAADLEIEKDGRTLNLLNFNDRPTYRAFIEACARLGATGIGAGPGYMTDYRVHVGFGSEAVWGKGGKASNAPDWVQECFRQGRAAARGGFESAGMTDLPDSGESEDETDF